MSKCSCAEMNRKYAGTFGCSDCLPKVEPPMTPEERAVVEKAELLADVSAFNSGWPRALHALRRDVQALRKSREPKLRWRVEKIAWVSRPDSWAVVESRYDDPAKGIAFTNTPVEAEFVRDALNAAEAAKR